MKFKKYIKQLKKGIFLEAFNLIKKKPKLYLFMLLMDACFLFGAFLIGKGGNLAVQPLLKLNPLDILVGMLFYILLLILLYSFTKYLALHFVKNMFKRIKLGLTKIGSFFLLNMVCVAIVFVTFFILGGIVKVAVKEALLTWTSRIVLFVLFLFTFAFISIAHSLFALDFSFKDVLKKCFKLVFNKVNEYYGVFVINGLVLGIYMGLYYGLGNLLDVSLTLNFNRYNTLFIWLGAILFYLIQAYNRVYFYLIVRHIKHK